MRPFGRLGMWNRLAFVAAIAAIVVLPLWGVADTNDNAGDIAGLGYRVCVEAGENNPRADIAAVDSECMAQFDRQFDRMRASWTTYGVGLLATAILIMLVYGVIAGIAWVAKWVWRGRNTNTA